MSIKLNAQSGGSVALDAPTQTTDSADITFKLPVADGSAGQVLMTNGSGVLSWTTIAAGISVAQQFRKTADQNIGNSQTVLDSNWEKVDDSVYGSLGTFADPSSGVFTFPSTGIWLVRFNAYWEDTGDTPLAQQRILVTTNNSSYTAVAEVNSSNAKHDTYTYCSGMVEYLLDVTDTSNVKVKFDARNTNTAVVAGSSSQNRTYVTFLRLGDT